MTISRRAFLALLGLAPAAALLPKVTLPEAPKAAPWPKTPITPEMQADITPGFRVFHNGDIFIRGEFTSAHGPTRDLLATWDGTTFREMDIHAISRSLDAGAARMIAMLEQAAADGLTVE